MTLPCIAEVRSASVCQCEKCTAAGIKAYLHEHPEKTTAFRNEKRVQKKPSASLNERIDYYINESGNWVFTPFRHLKRRLLLPKWMFAVSLRIYKKIVL